MTFVVGLLYLAILAGLAMLFLYLRDRLVEKREIHPGNLQSRRRHKAAHLGPHLPWRHRHQRPGLLA